MPVNEPLIPELCRRVLADVNRAVQGFARAHKYEVGADLRREAMAVARAADKAWYRPAERARWVSELVDGVDNLKVTMQLAKDLKAFASWRQFEALVWLVEDLGKQCGGWHKQQKYLKGQNPARNDRAPERARRLSTQAASAEANP